MKRLLSKIQIIILTLAMIAGCLSFSGREKVSAAYDVSFTDEQGIQYHYWTDSPTSYASVIGYTGKTGDVVIPEEVGKHRVYEIYNEAFKDNKIIESVAIPGSLHEIRSRAFENCTALNNISFTDRPAYFEGKGEEYKNTSTPINIASCVFSGCTSLKSITFTEGIAPSPGCETNKAKTGVFAGSSIEEVTVCWTYYTQVNGLFAGADKLKVINIRLRDDEKYCDYYDFQLATSTDEKVASVKEINIEHAEMISGTHGGYFYTDKNGKTKNAFTVFPNLKNINLYYGNTTGDGKIVVWNDFGKNNKTRYYVPWLAQCYDGAAYDNKTYTPECSDASVVNIISTGRKNEMEFVGSGTAVISYKDMPFTLTMHVSGGEKKKDLANAKASIPQETFAYTGKEIKPYTVVIFDGAVLENGTDYNVEFENNKNIGSASAKIKGKGGYTGEISVSFKIVPPVESNLENAVIGKKKQTLSWSAADNADGYQVYYSSKKAKGYKKLYSGTALKTDTTKLKSGMYIKIRTYKKVGKTTYYSEWSAPVQVK